MPDIDAPSTKLKVEIMDPTIEEAKNLEITISGKDPAAMLARVAVRLRGQGSQGKAWRPTSPTTRFSSVVDFQPERG